MKDGNQIDLFDKPQTRKWLWRLLWASCILSVLLELFTDRHGHFNVDGIFGFYAMVGFVACTIMILLSKLLGKFLKVEENYYKDDDAA